jgi:hypothetical protein
MVDDDIRRFAKVLEAVVKLSDLSTRELERRLELGGGTLNRIFTGKIDLKLRHILLVLEAVGMKPERFFQLASTQPPAGEDAGSALAAEILESFQRFGYSIGRPALTTDRPLTDEELDRRIEAALERVLERAGKEPTGALAAGVSGGGSAAPMTAAAPASGAAGPEDLAHDASGASGAPPAAPPSKPTAD